MVARVNLREANDPASRSEAEIPAPKTVDPLSQGKRPETGRYLLQVDRQTKASYATAETAGAAAIAIKTAHPIVQVSVYDNVECLNTAVELSVTPQ